MLLQIITPIVYFILFLFIVSNRKYFKTNSVDNKWWMLIFSSKVFSAVIYGYFFITGIVIGNDTFSFFYDADIVFSALKKAPLTYLELVFGKNDYTPVPQHLIYYTDNTSYWFDVSNYFLVRINALIRLISFGVYNVHAIIFAFLSFIGLYNIYLFFENKVYNKRILQFILFGIPSVVFWTSGVHKESLVIFSLGIILYNLNAIIQLKNIYKHIIGLLLGLLVLGFARVYLFAFLLPLILAIFIAEKYKIKKHLFWLFVLCIVIPFALLILVDISTPKISFLNELKVRRDFFISSMGHSSFGIQEDFNSFRGVLILLLQAVVNPVIRPLPGDCNALLAYLAFFETICLLIFAVTLLRKTRLKSILQNPYAIFSILFGFSALFLIGFIVNNSGALVRYRAIPIMFILIGLSLESGKK